MTMLVQYSWTDIEDSKNFSIMSWKIGFVPLYKHELDSPFSCTQPEFKKPLKKPNRFPAWRAGKTTLFDVPARQAT